MIISETSTTFGINNGDKINYYNKIIATNTLALILFDFDKLIKNAGLSSFMHPTK